MRLPLAQSVAEQLLQLTAEGLGVTLGVVLAFSIGLVGVVRSGEARSESRLGAALGWTALAVLGFLTFAAFVALALIVVTKK